MKKYQEPEIELLMLAPQEEILTISDPDLPTIDNEGYIGTPDYPIGG